MAIRWTRTVSAKVAFPLTVTTWETSIDPVALKVLSLEVEDG